MLLYHFGTSFIKLCFPNWIINLRCTSQTTYVMYQSVLGIEKYSLLLPVQYCA